MKGMDPLLAARQAVEASGNLDASAWVTASRKAYVRFGGNRITQNQDSESLSVTLTLGDGRRKASITYEDPRPEAARDAVNRVRTLMEASPEDPEYMPPLPEGQVYPLIHDVYDPEAADCPAERRMEAVRGVLDGAASHGLQAGGICQNNVTRSAVATSTGNLAEHEQTQVSLAFTLEQDDASSYRELCHESWEGIPWGEAVEKTAREALANRGKRDPEPGSYSLILEPQATTDLMTFLYWSMDGRRADEGLTVFSGMQGRPVSGSRFTLLSDPDGVAKGVPFSPEGLPARPVVWIREGILEELPCDRFWAKKTGREPLFLPGCLEMQGGEGSTDDLIRETERGILIRRFWYIRHVDPKTLKLTGMTRDGVFLVHNGEIRYPLKDFRWNWRPLEIFDRILSAGAQQRVAGGSVAAPPVRIGDVPFPCV